MKTFYVAVYDGRDGRLITRLPVNGMEGVAISPDCKLIAVGERLELNAETRDTQMNAKLYEVSSGKVLTTFVHDRLRIQRGRDADGSFIIWGIQFTADGKYLISSGRHTRIWRIG